MVFKGNNLIIKLFWNSTARVLTKARQMIWIHIGDGSGISEGHVHFIVLELGLRQNLGKTFPVILYINQDKGVWERGGCWMLLFTFFTCIPHVSCDFTIVWNFSFEPHDFSIRLMSHQILERSMCFNLILCLKQTHSSPYRKFEAYIK